MRLPLLTTLALAASLVTAKPVKSWKHPVAAPKVVLVSMFYPEDVWTDRLGLTQNITIPGLSPLYPDVHCNPSGEICQFVTGGGQINAAATLMSLLFSDAFDFTQSYFLIAGIAGVNPHVATLGSVGLARFAIQAAMAHELDPRQMPANWTTGYWLMGTDGPGDFAGHHIYGTELFELNTNLRDRVRTYTDGVALNDTAGAQAWRAQFDYAPANQPPSVVYGDVMTSDVYFTGSMLSEAFGNITKLWTGGEGEYAFTAQEDNASLEGMLRAHVAGKMDVGRVILMRTASNMDREPPGMDAFEAFSSDQGGFAASIENIFLAGNPIVQGIIADWQKTFKHGVQAQEGFLENFDALHTLTGNPVGVMRRGLAASRYGKPPMRF